MAYQLSSPEKGCLTFHRRKMSTHALQKMARDRFRAMSLAPRQKCSRNVVEMKEAMATFFLKNTHKNPKSGRVRQVPIWELSWEFPGWDLSHFAKFGIFMGIL